MTFARIWSSDAVWARGIRGALRPASALFGALTTLRNAAYDRGLLRTIASPVPTVSIGNLSVGGTGKTPVAAWMARALRDRGAHPAIVMRGYGDDEPRVHALLSPDVPVITNANRVAGIATAVQQGADVIVLDDGFQHRRAGRDLDVVLVSAEQWRDGDSVLPAGALRESPIALRRASLILVTHKVASAERVRAVARAMRGIAPRIPVASVHLHPGGLHQVRHGSGAELSGENSAALTPLDVLAGASVLAIAGIGDPASFVGQLDALGARVTPRLFPDHHAYTAADVAQLMAAAEGHNYVVTTLKDAVKLAPRWPPNGPPLWYVSQAMTASGGEPLLAAILTQLLSSRKPST